MQLCIYFLTNNDFFFKYKIFVFKPIIIISLISMFDYCKHLIAIFQSLTLGRFVNRMTIQILVHKLLVRFFF